MSRIALIKNNLVENVIEADMEFALSLSFDAVVETDAAAPGWGYVGGEFIAPAPAPQPEPEPTPEDRRITRLMFRNRFTQAEHVTIEIASLDDAAAPMQQRQMAAALRVMQRQVSDAEFIDLNDQVTRAGVQQLEAFGLLAEGRAAEILDGSLAPE
jgi:hypothetical protein